MRLRRYRFGGLTVAVGFLVFAAASPAAAAGPSVWTQMGHDAARTGYNAAEHGLAPPLTTAWAVRGDGVGLRGVVQTDGVVVAGSFGSVAAFDAATGAARWQHSGAELGGGEIAAVAAQRGIAYAVDDQNAQYPGGQTPGLYAFRLSDGTPLWHQPGGQPLAFGFPDLCGQPALTDRAVYTSTVSFDWSVTPPKLAWTLRAYDPVSGTPLWRRTPSFTAGVCAPSVDKRRVYVLAGSATGGPTSLVTLDAGNGRVRWSLPLPMGIDADDAPVIVGDHAYLKGRVPDTNTGLVVVVNLFTRSVERVTQVGSTPRRPAVDGTGNVYVFGCGFLTKLDAHGNQLATTAVEDTEGCGEGQALAIANGRLYATEFDAVHIYDTRTLAEVSSIGTGGVGSSAPAIAGGQIVFGQEFALAAYRRDG